MAIKKIQLRRDVPENWSLNNPVLSNGEIGIELPSSGSAKIKIGNGEKNWNDLDYFAGISDPLCEITYSELVNLRDSQSLVPGNWYRITDYITTTIQSNTKSAGNQFDLIVLALSENELSHHARAIIHEGDTYFDGNDLGAWQIWYDLDNDTEKYEWADAENGKGVIYRMIDEKWNDCPYDFKNILFYNNEYTSDTTSDEYYYTFSYVVSGILYDGTVEKQVIRCCGNSMGVYMSNKRLLNMNVWRNTSFGKRCSNNTFEYDCYNNTLGNGCDSNTFGKNCYNNTFEYDCYDNTFGNRCTYNTFGKNCYNNTFGDGCDHNTFGKNCYDNTLGNGCDDNTFDDYVTNRRIDQRSPRITTADEYYDDGSGQLVPIKHPDLSTQPSILPYKFMGNYVYEQLIPVKLGDRIVGCDFEVECPMILSAGVFGVNSFKSIDIMATKSDALLLNTESELGGYINVKYTDASQLLPSNGYGYEYEDNNIESSTLIDFGLSTDGTLYIYDPNTETLSLDKSGEITRGSIPQNCPIKNIIFGDGVISIGSNAFSYYNTLTSIIIPESVISIGSDAFAYCDNLTSIIIPESVTNIGDNAFSATAWYNNKPDGVIYINNFLYAYKGDMLDNTSIVIKDGTKYIVGSAFDYHYNLTSIIIPESVISIGSNAFAYCGLIAITIPKSMTSIGGYAFFNCRKLTAITSKAITPPLIAITTFENVDKSIPVYVPAESVDAYKAAEVWKDFTNIQAI